MQDLLSKSTVLNKTQTGKLSNNKTIFEKHTMILIMQSIGYEISTTSVMSYYFQWSIYFQLGMSF